MYPTKVWDKKKMIALLLIYTRWNMRINGREQIATGQDGTTSHKRHLTVGEFVPFVSLSYQTINLTQVTVGKVPLPLPYQLNNYD